MKIYVLIHEQDTDSAWGSHVSLFLNRDLAEATMRKCWEDTLKSWEFDLDKEMWILMSMTWTSPTSPMKEKKMRQTREDVCSRNWPAGRIGGVCGDGSLWD